MVIRILLQTTLLGTDVDDWNIARFSLLRNYLAGLKDDLGNPLCEVFARDRQPDPQGDDPLLSNLDSLDFDELWLFALDVGGGLSDRDRQGILRFFQTGGGILTTRDHQDMGIDLCLLENIGNFHYFHTRQNDPDPINHCRDDCYTLTIDWPNYHSGYNGDYQEIIPVQPLHEVLNNNGEAIRYLPAHPHEGGVGVSSATPQARVIAQGTSRVTGKRFNIAVAGDRIDNGNGHFTGRVIAQSTFHHFVDYNWDIGKGCPSFVEEPPGKGMVQEPQALQDTLAYVRNLVLWLARDRDRFDN